MLAAVFGSTRPTNLVIGTQMIYGPDDHVYNFTNNDPLTEQSHQIEQLGGTQMKIRLAPGTTCSGYRLDCGPNITSLSALAAVPAVAAALALPSIMYVQAWTYSFANPNPLDQDWTSDMLASEYNETYDLAARLLSVHDGTKKVFMLGNWEGDWMLMGSSGCRTPAGKFNMSCDPSPPVIRRMVQWARARQRAIADARSAVQSSASVLFYVELNLGPEAVAGKPGVTNDVVGAVGPDLVSYSSYSSTNAYKTTDNVTATDEALFAVLDYVESKLPPSPPYVASVFGGDVRRVFIGEYGVGPNTLDDATVVQFATRVASAALRWRMPFLLYWELYDNDSTAPIIPRSGAQTALWHWFRSYYAAASAFVAEHGGSPSAAAFSRWAAGYFAVARPGSCTFEKAVDFPRSEGYREEAATPQACCDACAANPGCAAGVHSGGACYLKYSVAAPQKGGEGVACIKKASRAGRGTALEEAPVAAAAGVEEV